MKITGRTNKLKINDIVKFGCIWSYRKEEATVVGKINIDTQTNLVELVVLSIYLPNKFFMRTGVAKPKVKQEIIV
jgi:hypothetical protein